VDPVVVKELGGMSRRGRTYFGRIFYVAVAGILVYAVAAPVFDGGGSPSRSEYALLGRRLFDSFAWLQMLFLPLVAAVGASDVISREARVGTLQVLLLTPLLRGTIITGKWKAVMFQVLTLALSGAPAMAVSVYLGGVGVVDVAWCFCLSMALSAIAAAMTIHTSLRDGTVVEAAFRAYFVLQLSCLPYMMVFGMARVGLWPADIVAFIHPYCAWYAAANPAKTGSIAAWGWIGATLVSAGFAWSYLMRSAGLLSDARMASAFLDQAKSAKPVRKPDDILCDRRPGPVWDEWPLLWKEVSLRSVRLTASARTVLLTLFTLLTLLCVFGRWESAVFQVFILGIVALILAVTMGAGHFVRENERKGFETLLSTPLSPLHVVAAKLLSGVMAAEFVVTAVFIAIGVAVLTVAGEVSAWLMATIPAFILFTYVFASAVSLRSKSFRSAFVTTAGVVLFLLVGIPVMMRLLQGSPIGDAAALRFASYALHPFRVYLNPHDLPWEDWVVPVNLATYLGGSALLVGHMILSFRSIAQRR
jgi:ABC-type transport system involved in multi-copper enzyme maturation permease subunit